MYVKHKWRVKWMDKETFLVWEQRSYWYIVILCHAFIWALVRVWAKHLHIGIMVVRFINKMSRSVDKLIMRRRLEGWKATPCFFWTVVGLAVWDNKTGHHRWRVTQWGAVCFKPELLFKNNPFNTFIFRICLFVFSPASKASWQWL